MKQKSKRHFLAKLKINLFEIRKVRHDKDFDFDALVIFFLMEMNTLWMNELYEMTNEL